MSFKKVANATGKPVPLEGPAGVGKAALAKAVAKALGRDLKSRCL
jgi:MoxR-like ATPase